MKCGCFSKRLTNDSRRFSLLSNCPRGEVEINESAKFQKLTRYELDPSHIFAAPTKGIDALSIDIILTLEQFSENNLTNANTNQASQMTQKRRAWADLLKEIRRLGVSNAVNAAVRSDVYQRTWILEQPHLPPSFGMSAQRCENYYYKITRNIPDVISILRDHSSDISTRDLEKALGMFINLFHTAATMRTK